MATAEWNLEGLGEARLASLDLGLLRSMCADRGIAIAAGAHGKTCVEKLLAWKQRPSPRPAGVAPTLADTPLPWDLKGFAKERLSKRDFKELREMCIARRIAPGSTSQLCVELLLEWKMGLKDEASSPTLPPSLPLQHDAHGCARRAPRAVVGLFEQRDYVQWRAHLKDLARDDVHGYCDALLDQQRGNGAYSLRPLGGAAHTSDAPEVDHIFECQAMGDLLFRVKSMRPMLRSVDWGAGTRGIFAKQPMVVQNALAHVRDVHNRPDFLVVCGSLANKKKQGAFQSCINTLAKGVELDHGIEQILQTNFCKGVHPFEPDLARRMARTVVDCLRGLEDPFTAALRDVPQGAAQGRSRQEQYDGLADEVVQLYEHFNITRHV